MWIVYKEGHLKLISGKAGWGVAQSANLFITWKSGKDLKSEKQNNQGKEGDALW